MSDSTLASLRTSFDLPVELSAAQKDTVTDSCTPGRLGAADGRYERTPQGLHIPSANRRRMFGVVVFDQGKVFY